MRRFGRTMRAFAGLVAAVAVSATALAAQAPAIQGRVTDKAAGKPVVGARVTLLGTSTVVSTNAEGRYVIRTAVNGEFRVRVNAIGYESQTKGATASKSGNTIDFEMTPSVLQIDELVTTATGEQSRLELGTVVANVKADSIAALNAVSNVSDVLNSRTPGVTVQTAGGTTGGGSRIRIRGANSISLSNDPIIYIDGVRANGASNGGDDIANFTAGQSFSRLNDINPDDIESIQVLKGPSATTQYGVDAANGVIVITTKRGQAGKTKWNFYAEGGVLNDRNKYPANYTAYSDGGLPYCTLGGSFFTGNPCTPDSLQSFNPLKDPSTTPFGPGWRQQYGLNVSGGTDALQYYVSGEFDDEVGVYRLNPTYQDSLKLLRGVSSVPFNELHPNAIRRVNFRSSVRAQVSSNADITATLGWVNSDGRLPQNDNNIFGIIPQGILGGTTRNTAWYGTGLGYGPIELFSLQTTQALQRLSGSVAGNWRPASWLSGRATVGIDQSQYQNIFYSPTGEGPSAFQYNLGFKNNNKYTATVYSVDAGLQATKAISSSLSSKSSVGLQYYRNSTNGAFAQGQFLTPGSGNIGGAAEQVAGESRISTVTGGAFLEQQFGYREKLYLTIGGRLDKASGFGSNLKTIFSPKANASWLAYESSNGLVNTLRLRAAYGQSSVQPGAFDAIQYYNAQQAAITNTGTKGVGITIGSLGNAGLKPEKSKEFEGGFDLSMLDGRAQVEFTAFYKKTTDALLAAPIAPSAGTGIFATTRFVNVASTRNQGLELGVNLNVLRSRSVAWDLGLSGSLLNNKVLSLGGLQPFFLGLGGASQRVIAGLPIAGLWQVPISYNDANKNGKVDFSEFTVGDSAVYVGPVLPTRELAANSAWSLFNNVLRISTTFDYRGGNYLNNSTTQFQCLFATCGDLYLPGTPLQDQANALALALQGAGSSSALAQKADFLRWRELSVTAFAPTSIAKSLGADRASITLAGRNLWRTTKYKGIDPEVNTTGQTNQSVADFLTQPPVRYFTARVNLTY